VDARGVDAGISLDITLLKTTEVSLEIFNLRGEKVATLLQSQKLSEGTHHYSIGLPKGIYLVSYTVGGKSGAKKVAITR
jgi:hypothetical protein